MMHMERQVVISLKKMNNMNIKGRLNYVFRLIIIAFSVVAVVISAMMIYMSMDYRRVLKRYAFPQGDIATAMSEAAEIMNSILFLLIN